MPAAGASTETASTGKASRTAARRTTGRRSRWSSRRARRRTAATGRCRHGSVGSSVSLGVRPLAPPHWQSNWELHLSHFSGELPKLEAFSNWTYGGRWQGIFGRYTYLGQPIFGFGSNAKGVPKDKYGRNLYIDTLNSAYGPGWKRESGILTHRSTGTFCHSFVPQRPFAGYPSQELRPAAPGERYRITVGGPGVMPVMQVEFPGLTQADLRRDDEINSVFDQVMAGDRVCAGER